MASYSFPHFCIVIIIVLNYGDANILKPGNLTYQGKDDQEGRHRSQDKHDLCIVDVILAEKLSFSPGAHSLLLLSGAVGEQEACRGRRGRGVKLVFLNTSMLCCHYFKRLYLNLCEVFKVSTVLGAEGQDFHIINMLLKTLLIIYVALKNSCSERTKCF